MQLLLIGCELGHVGKVFSQSPYFESHHYQFGPIHSILALAHNFGYCAILKMDPKACTLQYYSTILQQYFLQLQGVWHKNIPLHYRGILRGEWSEVFKVSAPSRAAAAAATKLTTEWLADSAYKLCNLQGYNVHSHFHLAKCRQFHSHPSIAFWLWSSLQIIYS